MRALHVITGLGVGGAEQQLRLLLRHLPVECDVVTLTNPGPVADGLRADGIRVVHLGMRGNRDLSAVGRLTRLIRDGRYDLVHTHLYRACVYGRIAARLAGVRAAVATEHSLGRAEIEGRPLTRGIRALYLSTERLGAATVAVSSTVAGRLRDWGCPPTGSGWCPTASTRTSTASTRTGGSPSGRHWASPTTRSWSAAWAAGARQTLRRGGTGGRRTAWGPAAAGR